MREVEMEALYEKLKEKGIRLTPQRRMILNLLKGTTEHLTAEEIYQHIKQQMQPISLGTVYNTLHKLKDTGVIQELTYGDMSSRYDGLAQPHYHVTCPQCGRVVDFYWEQLKGLEQEASQATGFTVSDHRVEFYGLCPQCNSEQVQEVSS